MRYHQGMVKRPSAVINILEGILPITPDKLFFFFLFLFFCFFFVCFVLFFQSKSTDIFS